jgi:maleylacetoacetate isomerase
MLKLYSYFRSSASYRARIALHWKHLKFEYVPVHLTKDGGQQLTEAYRRINPMAHVPTLDHDGFLLAESVAIADYLDRVFPDRPLFPADPRARARVLQICEILNSGIQPLQNLKVTQYLEHDLALSKESSQRWARHWIRSGMANLEKLLSECAGTFAFGGEITLADAFIVSQCFSSRRFGVPVEDFPNIARVDANAAALPEFRAAHPKEQPDYSA